MRLPGIDGRQRRIIFREIMLRRRRGRVNGAVTQIFEPQRVGIVLGMPGDVDLAAVDGSGDVNARFGRIGQQQQRRIRFDIALVNVGVARVRRAKRLVEAAQQGMRGQPRAVAKYAGELLLERMLVNTVVVIQSGKRTPADIQRSIDVRFRTVA